MAKKFDLFSNKLLTALFYAVIGVMLVIMKAGSLGILMTVVGALFIILGIVDYLNKKDPVKAILEIAIGIAIIACGWLIADVVLLVFGVFLILRGVVDVWKNRKATFENLLSPLACIVIGLLLVIAKWAFMDAMCLVAGILFIINAILVLFGKPLTKK